jgi:hypothetical protein
MSAERAAIALLMAVLGSDRDLLRAVHAIYPEPSPRKSPPLLEIGAMVASDWGTKDRPGCELAVELRHFAAATADLGVVSARIRALVPMLRGGGDGWEIVSARLTRTRSGYDRQGRFEQNFAVRLRCLEIRP